MHNNQNKSMNAFSMILIILPRSSLYLSLAGNRNLYDKKFRESQCKVGEMTAHNIIKVLRPLCLSALPGVFILFSLPHPHKMAAIPLISHFCCYRFCEVLLSSTFFRSGGWECSRPVAFSQQPPSGTASAQNHARGGDHLTMDL